MPIGAAGANRCDAIEASSAVVVDGNDADAQHDDTVWHLTFAEAAPSWCSWCMACSAPAPCSVIA